MALSAYPLSTSTRPPLDWRSLLDPVAVVSTGNRTSLLTAADVAASQGGTWHGKLGAGWSSGSSHGGLKPFSRSRPTPVVVASTKPVVSHRPTPSIPLDAAPPRRGPTPAFTFQPRSYRGTPLPPRRGGAGSTAAPSSSSGLVVASSVDTTATLPAETAPSSSLMPLLLAAGALYSMS